MSRSANITYQAVAELCHTLSTRGERPKITKIREQLGGSFSTLQGFLQQWQEEQRQANKGLELSEAFRQAVLAEFARINETVKQQFQSESAETKAQLEEIRKVLSEYEAKNTALTQELLTHQNTAAQTKITLEKELTIAKVLVEESNKRETALQSQLEALRESRHLAETRAAVAEAHHQEVEKQIDRLEREIQALKKLK